MTLVTDMGFPCVRLYPEKYFAAQSLDNQILVYSTDNFRQARNKRFAGHSVAGYACQVGFSPDGKWISSGDGEGNVVYWEWKTGRIKSRLKAHSKVVIAHEWLPHDTVCRLHWLLNCLGMATLRLMLISNLSCVLQSKVITASWDGLIKLWVRPPVDLLGTQGQSRLIRSSPLFRINFQFCGPDAVLLYDNHIEFVVDDIIRAVVSVDHHIHNLRWLACSVFTYDILEREWNPSLKVRLRSLVEWNSKIAISVLCLIEGHIVASSDNRACQNISRFFFSKNPIVLVIDGFA